MIMKGYLYYICFSLLFIAVNGLITFSVSNKTTGEVIFVTDPAEITNIYTLTTMDLVDGAFRGSVVSSKNDVVFGTDMVICNSSKSPLQMAETYQSEQFYVVMVYDDLYFNQTGHYAAQWNVVKPISGNVLFLEGGLDGKMLTDYDLAGFDVRYEVEIDPIDSYYMIGMQSGYVIWNLVSVGLTMVIVALCVLYFVFSFAVSIYRPLGIIVVMIELIKAIVGVLYCLDPYGIRVISSLYLRTLFGSLLTHSEYLSILAITMFWHEMLYASLDKKGNRKMLTTLMIPFILITVVLLIYAFARSYFIALSPTTVVYTISGLLSLVVIAGGVGYMIFVIVLFHIRAFPALKKQYSCSITLMFMVAVVISINTFAGSVLFGVDDLYFVFTGASIKITLGFIASLLKLYMVRPIEVARSLGLSSSQKSYWSRKNSENTK